MKHVWNKIQEKLIMMVISDLVAASTHWTSWKRVVSVAEIEPHYQIPVDAWKCSLIEGYGLEKRICNARLLLKLTSFRKRAQKQREIKDASEVIAYTLTWLLMLLKLNC